MHCTDEDQKFKTKQVENMKSTINWLEINSINHAIHTNRFFSLLIDLQKIIFWKNKKIHTNARYVCPEQ